MIRYSKEEGFIKPYGIKFKENQNKNIKLPSVAIMTFSRRLIEDIVQKYNCEEVGYMSCANYEKKVYILKYHDKLFTLSMASVSAPMISGDIEELHANGVNTFIIYGNCGVLDRTIEDCSMIIPTKAFRDEGISYHYQEASDDIEMNQLYINDFINILKEYNFSYRTGATWTTDAFYRETKDKIEYFKKNGAICVEMEGAAIAAICKRKKINYFTFYYAGDNLDATSWEERSIGEITMLDKKKEVTHLALNLAYKISSDKI